LRIILFRHGIAIDRDDPSSPVEEDRFLTDEGIEKTRAAALGLARLGVVPDRILSSPWLRARQTAEIAAEALGFDEGRIELSDALLPFSPVSALVELVSVPAAREVVVAGHAPHLDEALSALTEANAVRMKKAAAACIELVDPGFASGRLEWFLPPRALRDLGAGRDA
jgi:phosphohistidine phosphatase